jgi:hypothetical protein
MVIRTSTSFRARRMLFGALTYCALASVTSADTLHNIGSGDFQHHDSGWIFPERIGEFTRIGAPQDVDGTIDVVAHYARVHNGKRTTAIIDVYPASSSAPAARYEDAVAEMRPAAASSETGELKIDGPLPLKAMKTHSLGNGLYFLDTGLWIVKVRTRSESADASNDDANDQFVRQQRWDSLNLTQAACTGPACAHATR